MGGARGRIVGALSVALLGALAALGALALIGGTAEAAVSPACAPGSGPDLHAKRLTAAFLERRPDLRCADLSGSDLSGLSLIQRDLQGALLRGANLTGADLTQADLTGADLTSAHLAGAHLGQATLTGAVFRGADLSHADLVQVDAQRADFTGADLSNTDLTQAHLENAQLDHADVGGIKTTQAYLSGTSFKGARGVRPWDRYLLIGCAALYAFLVLGAVRTHLRRGTRSKLPLALLGRLILVAGVHLFAGFVLGRIASASGPPVDQTCNGVQCSLGVAAGSWATYVGFLLIFVGALVSGASGRRRTAVSAPASAVALPAQLAALRRLAAVRAAPPGVPPAVGSSAPPGVPPAVAPTASAPPAPMATAPPLVTTPPMAITPPMLTSPTVPAAPPGRVLTPEQSLLPPEVLQLALAGNKRAAARKYRQLTGSSRWEAKSVLQGL